MSTVCDVCKGTGKQKVTATIVSYDEQPQVQDPVAIDCIWCNGTGFMTPNERQELEDYRNAWCRCHKNERSETFVWNERTARYDTVCETCGGYLVIG